MHLTGMLASIQIVRVRIRHVCNRGGWCLPLLVLTSMFTMDGCSMVDPCIEDVAVSVENSTSRMVFLRWDMSESLGEVVVTSLPPGGNFKQFVFPVVLGRGPVVAASLSRSFSPEVLLKVDWSTGETRIVEREGDIAFQVEPSGRRHP